MNSNKYFCRHCNQSFDSEQTGKVECPFCYWSTSVIKKDSASHLSEATSSKTKKTSSKFIPGMKVFKIIAIIFGIMALFLLFWFALGALESIAEKNKDLVDISFYGDKKENVSEKKITFKMNDSDRQILLRRVNFKADRPFTETETEILEGTVEFKTGWSEEIPTSGWTFEQFMEMLNRQEKLYKVPLSKKYKKKLKTLFETKYLLASDAFKKGDLIEARDFWTESLAFPMYSDDVMRHRGVALTMLRPFINDVLSKIGALNQILIEKQIRRKEEDLLNDYGVMMEFIKKKSWEEANKTSNALIQKIEELEDIKGGIKPPPYPDVLLTQIDQGIREVLIRIAGPNLPAMTDFTSFKKDVLNKQIVIKTFSSEYISDLMESYDTAILKIRIGNYKKALELLKSLRGPAILENDRIEKIEILEKINEQTLDSSYKTS